MTRPYKTNAMTHRPCKRFHVTFDGPEPEPTFKEQLLAKIARDEAFIRDYPNYSWLCGEAQVRLAWYRERLAAIEKQEQAEVTAPDAHLEAQYEDCTDGGEE